MVHIPRQKHRIGHEAANLAVMFLIAELASLFWQYDDLSVVGFLKNVFCSLFSWLDSSNKAKEHN